MPCTDRNMKQSWHDLLQLLPCQSDIKDLHRRTQAPLHIVYWINRLSDRTVIM